VTDFKAFNIKDKLNDSEKMTKRTNIPNDDRIFIFGRAIPLTPPN